MATIYRESLTSLNSDEFPVKTFQIAAQSTNAPLIMLFYNYYSAYPIN